MGKKTIRSPDKERADGLAMDPGGQEQINPGSPRQSGDIYDRRDSMDLKRRPQTGHL
jgi:hypothetical protein